MKIKILYSHLNVSGHDGKYRPQWFDFEKCFKNLLSTLYDKEKINYTNHIQEGVELHVIYDKTRGGIEQNWIIEYCKYPQIHFHEVVGGSMFGAAKEMFRVAKELSEDMKEDDLFYFMENDYLHVEGWVDKVKELFSTFNGLNYVTLYDHNDKYTWMHLYENLTSKIFATETHHWRTVPNTCGTYLVNKKIFLEDYDSRTTIEGDANYWAWLAENKDRFIISALPGLSTHCMETLLSPTIDWKKINN